jgi:hypothetical protein
VVEPVVSAVRDGAVVVQRREHRTDRGEHVVDACDVEEGLLLPGEGASGRSSAVAEERTANEAPGCSAVRRSYAVRIDDSSAAGTAAPRPTPGSACRRASGRRRPPRRSRRWRRRSARRPPSARNPR